MASNAGEPPTTAGSTRLDDDRNRREASGRSKSNKFRFKSKHRSRDDDPRHNHHRHRRRHHHGYHRASKRPKTPASPEHDPSSYEQQQPPSLSPDAAFRESLFDALADDEGADYWQSVYGQPVHTYPNMRPGPEGELEQMDEEEYAAYVRAKMWERTHQGLLEERERRRLEKEKEKERARERVEANNRSRRINDDFEKAVEESLSRGRERRRKKAWIEVWDRYLRSWDRLNSSSTGTPGDGVDRNELHLRNLICWPVESGKRADISQEAVESFIRHAPGEVNGGKADDINLINILKMERVRWHPDKIQQRYGGLGIEEPVMKSVTEVFQILDDMWNEEKGRATR